MICDISFQVQRYKEKCIEQGVSKVNQLIRQVIDIGTRYSIALHKQIFLHYNLLYLNYFLFHYLEYLDKKKSFYYFLNNLTTYILLK